MRQHTKRAAITLSFSSWLTESSQICLQRYKQSYLSVPWIIDLHCEEKSFIPSFVCSFIHVFLHSFVSSFTCSFIHLFLYSCVPSFICSFVHLFLHSFTHSIFIASSLDLDSESASLKGDSYVNLLVRSFIHCLRGLFIHSFLCSFIRWYYGLCYKQPLTDVFCVYVYRMAIYRAPFKKRMKFWWDYNHYTSLHLSCNF